MGPLFYLLIFLGIVAFFVYYNIRSSGAPKKVVKSSGDEVDVAEVTEATRSFSDVQARRNDKDEARIALDDARGQRVGGVDSGYMDALAYIDENMTQKQKGKRSGGEDGTLELTDRKKGPNLGAAGAPEANIRPQDMKNLIVYEAPEPPVAPVVAPSTVHLTGFETNRFLPRGTLIPVYFLTNVQTRLLEDIVILGVAENVIFNHRVQLPFGTRLLGTAAAGAQGTRIAINIDTILYPDGSELPISALGKDVDRGPGVKGYYIPQPLWVQLLPYVNEFVASYIDTFQKTREQQTTGLTPGGITVSQTQQVTDYSDPGTVALASASTALRDQMKFTQQQLNSVYQPYTVIPVGTAAFVQLRSAVDLTSGSVNGASKSTMPILPGFQQNPITPSGTINNQVLPVEQRLELRQGMGYGYNPQAMRALQQIGANSGTLTGEGVPNTGTGIVPLNQAASPFPDLNNPTYRNQINTQNQQGLERGANRAFGLQ